jgi:type II secretory pathway pseudopilin PulG
MKLLHTLSNSRGAHLSRLSFGVPRAGHLRHGKALNGGLISHARVSREGATHSARGGRGPQSGRGFTIIEIAICLGIIGFALVAIIAALPRGLDVQKRNRQETIVGQDEEVWMNVLRGGTKGYDDLTNYVIAITNTWTQFDDKLKPTATGNDYYTPTLSKVTSIAGRSPDDFILTNGARIVGLLSMPIRIPMAGYIPFPVDAPYQSNHVVAYVRAFSGPIVDKTPQTNADILADAFKYRMVVENFPYAAVDTNAFCVDCPDAIGLNPAQLAERTNLSHAVFMLQTNAQDFRLLFRWPVLPNGEIPTYGRATFRGMVDGSLLITNEPAVPNQPLYFVQPSSFTQVTKHL